MPQINQNQQRIGREQMSQGDVRRERREIRELISKLNNRLEALFKFKKKIENNERRRRVDRFLVDLTNKGIGVRAEKLASSYELSAGISGNNNPSKAVRENALIQQNKRSGAIELWHGVERTHEGQRLNELTRQVMEAEPIRVFTLRGRDQELKLLQQRQREQRKARSREDQNRKRALPHKLVPKLHYRTR